MKKVHELATNIGLKIVQDTELNNFTFDSVLLANFTKVTKKTYYAVDLCSGNAPIAMLISTKKDNLKIKAVELQSNLSELGAESIEMNQLGERIEMICDNLIGISNKIGKNKYDLITCNPPYFRIDPSSNLNVKSEIAIARHEVEVNLEDIIRESSVLLNNTGTLTMVHRPDRLDELIHLFGKYNFTVKRIQFVYPKENRLANTLLIEVTKRSQINNKLIIEEPFFVYNNDNTYTEQALQAMEF